MSFRSIPLLELCLSISRLNQILKFPTSSSPPEPWDLHVSEYHLTSLPTPKWILPHRNQASEPAWASHCAPNPAQLPNSQKHRPQSPSTKSPPQPQPNRHPHLPPPPSPQPVQTQNPAPSPTARYIARRRTTPTRKRASDEMTLIYCTD